MAEPSDRLQKLLLGIGASCLAIGAGYWYWRGREERQYQRMLGQCRLETLVIIAEIIARSRLAEKADDDLNTRILLDSAVDRAVSRILRENLGTSNKKAKKEFFEKTEQKLQSEA